MLAGGTWSRTVPWQPLSLRSLPPPCLRPVTLLSPLSFAVSLSLRQHFARTFPCARNRNRMQQPPSHGPLRGLSSIRTLFLGRLRTVDGCDGTGLLLTPAELSLSTQCTPPLSLCVTRPRACPSVGGSEAGRSRDVRTRSIVPVAAPNERCLWEWLWCASTLASSSRCGRVSTTARRCPKHTTHRQSYVWTSRPHHHRSLPAH
jgi:hypothetical protein